MASRTNTEQGIEWRRVYWSICIDADTKAGFTKSSVETHQGGKRADGFLSRSFNVAWHTSYIGEENLRLIKLAGDINIKSNYVSNYCYNQERKMNVTFRDFVCRGKWWCWKTIMNCVNKWWRTIHSIKCWWVVCTSIISTYRICRVFVANEK